MSELVRHRGPDDEGYMLLANTHAHPQVLGGVDTPREVYASTLSYTPNKPIFPFDLHPVKLAFGHRRLAIIDPSPCGHQPMSSPDMDLWIVFNGEIYNHIELRKELEALGHHFTSHSDTEVILAAYRQWGTECLHRFNGMWALAIYDTRQQEVFLARDRFGVKPLYYWVSPDGLFAFASEIKQFSALPGWEARLNGQRGYDFLAYGLSDHTNETMFEGVLQLPPGHQLRLPCSNKLPSIFPVERWYTLTPKSFSGTFEDASEEFCELFLDSVRLRLRADVPVGSCLSGGLDSSSIVCVIKRLLKDNGSVLLKSFSACADVDRFDERKWIEAVVAETGIEAHYVYPSLDRLFDESPTITWHQDEPYGSTSIYAQWNVFRLAAKNNVKVMLDGQGADEQLAGYHGYFWPQLSTLFRSLRWLELMHAMQAMRKLHGYSFSSSSRHLANHLMPICAYPFLRQLTGYGHWINMDKLGATPRDPFIESGARKASVQALSYSQLTASNLQMLLHWEDRDSMTHSIESRVPFLDYRLVEFTLGLPDEFKISRGVTKRVLRGAMNGILPPSICGRLDKLGFVTPEEVWLREQAPHLFRDKTAHAIEVANGILHPERTRLLIEEIIQGRKNFSFLPWRIISFGEWIDAFSVRV